MANLESFPNAEAAFRHAFNQLDPTSKLIELVRAHPQHLTILDLVSVYTELTAEHPTQVDKYARALVNLRNSNETIAACDEFGNPAQREIGAVLNRELAGLHSGDLVFAKDPLVTPSNDYLVASLLSAVSLKYGLCDSPGQVGAILQGLYFKDKQYRSNDRATYEVLVLGACLQLLVSGSYLYGPAGTDVGRVDVVKALEAIKGGGIVTNGNGVELLEVCH